MTAGRDRRPLVPFVLAAALVVLAGLFASPAGAEGATPTIRMFVSAENVTVERNGRGFVRVDPGAYATPVGADFKLVVNRPDYDTPVTAKQVDPQTGNVLRTFDADTLDGWTGLKDFTHYEVLNGNGVVVASDTLSFCPNAYNRARLSDDSPLTPTYPWQCDSGFAPFTRGSIWGIDRGWAVPLVGGGYYYGGAQLFWKAPGDSYTVRVSIEPAWADRLSIPADQATADVHVTVVPKGSLPEDGRTANAAAEQAAQPFTGTPIVTQPPTDTLPDLIALPGWNMDVRHRRTHEFLNFFATEWNEGPGPLLIDGFRSGDEPELDAYQYFMRDGEPVGRALIGSIHYHARHNHWHFEQFTQYSLLDADKNVIQLSNKRSWCLAPTDAIDLSVPNGDWGQQRQDVGSSCGFDQPSALWIREALPVGWGDTYSQAQNFGGFDITNLPNGTYYVRTTVNPTGSIIESSSDNNVEDRLIRLRGKPGHRRVVVPPWHGIDTENLCGYYC
jgi:lysyl oxidase